MQILQVEGLSKNFGGLAAVSGVDLQVESGEILGLIGPNGAGKTTLFNLISGTIAPNSGKVIFNNEVISGLKPHAICKKDWLEHFNPARLFRE